MTESGLDPNGVPYWMSALRIVPANHDAHYQEFLREVRGIRHEDVFIDLAEVKRVERGLRDDFTFDRDRERAGVAR